MIATISSGDSLADPARTLREEEQASRLKPRLLLAAKLVVTTAILIFVLRQVQVADLWRSLAGMRWELFCIGLLQLLVIPFLGGIRWKVVLRAIQEKSRTWPLTRLFWIGMLFGQVLPSTAGGDVARVWMAWRLGIGLRGAFSSVVLERASMLLTLIALVAVLQPFLASRVGVGGPLWVAPVLLAASVAGLALLMSADRFLGRFSALRPVRVVACVSTDARRVYLSRYGSRLLLTCMLSHVNLCMAAWWIGLSLGLPLGLMDYLVFIPVVTIATVLPISIGGWGVREGTSVVLLGAVGVPSHSALAFSVLFGLAVGAVSLPVLALWWRSPERKQPRRDVSDLLVGDEQQTSQ